MRTFRNLEEAYVYATEVNMATLDELAMLKSTSNYRLRRQRDICFKMLYICQSRLVDDAKVDWGTEFHRMNYPRVSEILKDAKTESEGLGGALDRHVAKLKQPPSARRE